VSNQTISVISPVYRNEASLEKLTTEIIKAVQNDFSDYEIILVEDGSMDGSWKKICELSQNNPKIKGIKLSRNFGQHVATAAGLKKAKNDWVCTIDADLQDPPSYIPQFYAKTKEGFDVIYGITRNKKTSFIRKMLSRSFFWTINKFTGQKLMSGLTSFTFMSQRSVQEHNRFSDIYKNHVFVLMWIGLPSTFVSFDRDHRDEGQSSYNLSTLIRYALAGIYFFPANFIQYFVRFGFIIAFSSIAYSIIVLLKYYLLNIQPGWTSLAVLVSFFGGLTLSSIGIVGLYVGKIFEQVKNRPLYVVESEVGEK
jgi:glycosyltransferase involved in cell wall biosynthesis